MNSYIFNVFQTGKSRRRSLKVHSSLDINARLHSSSPCLMKNNHRVTSEALSMYLCFFPPFNSIIPITRLHPSITLSEPPTHPKTDFNIQSRIPLHSLYHTKHSSSRKTPVIDRSTMARRDGNKDDMNVG